MNSRLQAGLLVGLVVLIGVLIAPLVFSLYKRAPQQSSTATPSIAERASPTVSPTPQEDYSIDSTTWQKQISYVVPKGWREDAALSSLVSKAYVSPDYVASNYGNPTTGTAIFINSSTNKNKLTARQYLENLKASVGPSDFSIVGISGFQAVRYRNSYEQNTIDYAVVTPTKIWYFAWYIPNKGDVNKEQAIFEQFMKSVKLSED